MVLKIGVEAGRGRREGDPREVDIGRREGAPGKAVQAGRWGKRLNERCAMGVTKLVSYITFEVKHLLTTGPCRC